MAQNISYWAAKRIGRGVVGHAHRDADRAVYNNIDPKSSEIFCLVNQMRRENVDVVGDKSVRNDAGEIE